MTFYEFIINNILGFCLVGWRGLGNQAGLAMSEATGELAPPLTPMPSLWSEFFKILVVLGCLLGGLLLIRYFLRNPFWLKKNSPPAQMIQVLATHYLEPKKSLLLVEVGTQQFLLANTAEHLTLLTTLESSALREATFSNRLDQAVNHHQAANETKHQRDNHVTPK
jgi:flagellar biogenesis protein FliO